jgi:cyclopropane fatty-acyl-phospholipid synthase-like methyltransferase
MRKSHEQHVERFYSHGSDTRGLQDGGYLSFGYWPEPDMDYSEAVDALIKHVLDEERSEHVGVVLNVACGYGSETMKLFEVLQPERVVAIDVTDSHIRFAKHHVRNLRLADRISFEKKDACTIDYPRASFDYVIGIEGPAHFNTRETFLRKAYRALKPNGVLLLTDIIVDNSVIQKGWFNHMVGALCAKYWYMPKANWMSIAELRHLLTDIGFEVRKAESLGDLVYPGFARFNLRWKSIKNAIRTRGLRIGILLTFISWLLGFVHRRRIIDYTFIRAIKPGDDLYKLEFA